MVFDKKHPIKIIYIKNESFVFAQPLCPKNSTLHKLEVPKKDKLRKWKVDKPVHCVMKKMGLKGVFLTVPWSSPAGLSSHLGWKLEGHLE